MEFGTKEMLVGSVILEDNLRNREAKDWATTTKSIKLYFASIILDYILIDRNSSRMSKKGSPPGT